MRRGIRVFALLALLSMQTSAHADELVWSEEPWILAKTPDTFFDFGFGCHLFLPSADKEFHVFIWVNDAEVVVYDPKSGLSETSGSLTLKAAGTEKFLKLWPASYEPPFARARIASSQVIESLRGLAVEEPISIEVAASDGLVIGTFPAPHLSTALDRTEECVESIQW